MSAPPAALRLDVALVGATARPVVHALDARWLMAYAAALGETDLRYFDTETPAGPMAHPLFPVCYEWPLAVELRERVVGEAIAPLGVHLTHDLVIHRAPRAGDRLTTTARVIAATPHRAGTLVVVRFETVDGAGAPVTTTDYGSLYRGVALDGAAAGPARQAPARDGESPVVRWQERIEVPASAAHVYTECARIWNPIHTDIVAARSAGLPGLILHGTATLALAVSRVVRRDLGGDASAVRRVAARFTGMVAMPSVVVVRGLAGDPHRFDAVGADGQPLLSGGHVEP
jgi:acyl dehydratase